MKVLGISGSLRQNSFNNSILNTVSELFPPSIKFNVYDGLHLIPPFNPDDEESQAVKHFKEKVAESDAVIISTPEYAFGVPGVLKNALDWTVSTGEFNEKPISVISASPLNTGGDKALASLLLTLTALGTKKNNRSSLSIPNIKLKMSPDGHLNHPETVENLRLQVENLLKIIG